jgi:hypothetical protein
MEDRLYLGKTERYVQADPVRGINKSRVEYSNRRVIVAGDRLEATKKFSSHYKSWNYPNIIELTAGADVSLEKRIEILGEIFDIIR